MDLEAMRGRHYALSCQCEFGEDGTGAECGHADDCACGETWPCDAAKLLDLLTPDALWSAMKRMAERQDGPIVISWSEGLGVHSRPIGEVEMTTTLLASLTKDAK